MSYNPNDVICEILGRPAAEMNDPASEGFLCPFKNSICMKRSHNITGPLPVCSIYLQRKDKEKQPVAVCPRRLYAADIFHDVIEYCWPGEKPTNPILVREVKMGDVGNVDMVIADLSEDGTTIKNFVSIELQAIDITGTYEPAYSSIIHNSVLEKRPTYNFNYRNVQKRFVTQLIDKGIYHHHWETKIVAVVQDVVYENLHNKIAFPELSIDQSNVVFLQYAMVLTKTSVGPRYQLKLKKVTGTQHNALMMSSFYKKAPPKEKFCQRILTVYKADHK